jgi:hypothetical protein
MPRHIDIELTSHASDGSWTWRAVGARHPRGALVGGAVPAGASIGDTFRAEVESGIEGIEVVELLPPKPSRATARTEGRIEVIGAPRRSADISVTLAPGSRRRRDDGERPPRRDGPGRGEGRSRGPSAGRGRSERPEGAPPGRDHAERPGPGRDHAERPRPGRDRAERPGSGRDGEARRPAGRPAGDAAAPGRRDRERRPSVSTAHRNAALAGLRPEQLPIAEAILRGGIPAVRQSIDEQNASARAGGKPPVAADAILKIAENLLPVVKLAEWKDRATSAQSAGRELRLRELRAVVAGSRTVILDEEGRGLARSLQESLDHRVTALRDDWTGRITKALDEGRTLEALHVTARAPEPGTRLSAELAVRLAEAAGAAMTPDLAAEEWLELLDAVVDSPVRRTVKPVGVPKSELAATAALNAAGLLPALAHLLGLRIPPPPPRRTTVRRSISSLTGGGRAAGS